MAGNGFANHRSGDESCRRVWLVAVGAGVPAGTGTDRPIRTSDVAPTVARILGFKMEGTAKAGHSRNWPSKEDAVQDPVQRAVQRRAHRRRRGARNAATTRRSRVCLRRSRPSSWWSCRSGRRCLHPSSGTSARCLHTSRRCPLLSCSCVRGASLASRPSPAAIASWRGDPARFQDEAQALLRKQKLLQAWRREVDAFFQPINPALEPQLVPGGCAAAPCRAGVWQRHRCRSPETLEPVQRDRRPRAVAARTRRSDPREFLPSLFGARPDSQEGSRRCWRRCVRRGSSLHLIRGWSSRTAPFMTSVAPGRRDGRIQRGRDWFELRPAARVSRGTDARAVWKGRERALKARRPSLRARPQPEDRCRTRPRCSTPPISCRHSSATCS